MKRHAFLLSFSALLLMGSSGCILDDINEVTGFAGDGGDVLAHALGESTGDKGTDAALQAGDTMKDLEEVRRLEDIADSSLSTRPPTPGYALIQIEAALKLRPNDWSLINKRGILKAEMGKDPEGFTGITDACKATMPDQRDRCGRMVMRERVSLMDQSIARQKAGTQLVSCATYTTQGAMYRAMIKTFYSGNQLKYTQAQVEEFQVRVENADRLAANPGTTCSSTYVEAPVPIVPL